MSLEEATDFRGNVECGESRHDTFLVTVLDEFSVLRGTLQETRVPVVDALALGAEIHHDAVQPWPKFVVRDRASCRGE